jgi:aspartyl/glutamyl-tRNA(Asn/Gln) amidotransferase C subunit
MNVRFDFDYLCASSRLKLSDDEKRSLSPQLKRIVNWIAELERAVPQEKDFIFHQFLSCLDTLRKDRRGSSFTSRQALFNSPENKHGYFTVPRVINSK